MAGRCCHKRRLENRLMVRRRDPQGLRRRGPRFEELSGQWKVKIKSCRDASGHRGNIKILI